MMRLGVGGVCAGALVVALWYVNELRLSEVHTYAGLPRQQGWSDPHLWVHVLRKPGFAIGYSELRRHALWVAYRVRPVKVRQHLPRPGHFGTDRRTWMRVTQAGYAGSGYDRGHLAPNYVISQLYGRQAQLASFQMSNISPQRPALNRQWWQRLEEVEVDYFARWFEELWVMTGPVFDAQRQWLPGGIEIPDAFYRIILDVDADAAPRVIAFLVPQEVRGDADLAAFVVSVDQIEALTGLDFFWQLDDALENQLEASMPDPQWRLSEIGQLPARYSAQ